MTKNRQKYLRNLTSDDRWTLLVTVIERLEECEEIKFRQEDVDCEPCFFWVGSGDDLLKEKESTP